jgi:uncharacterized protein (DUF3084 family)
MSDDITPPNDTPPPAPAPSDEQQFRPLKEIVSQDARYQAELNKMMAENRRSLTNQNQELVKQLETLRQNSQLTQEERDTLQVQITQLEEQYLSKEEIAKRESSKAQKAYEEKLSQAEGSVNQWRQRYADSTIHRAWQDAAISGKALKPAIPQISEMFRHRTELVERIVDGKPSGEYDAIVKFPDVNEEGNEVTLDMTPAEAVKRMKELPEKYGYLFEGAAKGGAGLLNNADGTSRQPAFQELMDNPVKYAAWRKENPDVPIEKLMRR